MRVALLIACTWLVGCGEAESARRQHAQPPVSGPCSQKLFEESRFTVCETAGGRIELVAAGPKESATRAFDELQAKLGKRASDVAFAMNAGMFDEEGRPIGLAI